MSDMIANISNMGVEGGIMADMGINKCLWCGHPPPGKSLTSCPTVEKVLSYQLIFQHYSVRVGIYMNFSKKRGVGNNVGGGAEAICYGVD